MSTTYTHDHVFAAGEVLCTVCRAAHREDCDCERCQPVQTTCPAWCQRHLETEHERAVSGHTVVHQATVTVGDASVTIERCDNPLSFEAPGTYVDQFDWNWISDETIRNYAAALSKAADLIGVPAAGTPAPHVA